MSKSAGTCLSWWAKHLLGSIHSLFSWAIANFGLLCNAMHMSGQVMMDQCDTVSINFFSTMTNLTEIQGSTLAFISFLLNHDPVCTVKAKTCLTARPRVHVIVKLISMLCPCPANFYASSLKVTNLVPFLLKLTMSDFIWSKPCPIPNKNILFTLTLFNSAEAYSSHFLAHITKSKEFQANETNVQAL